MGIEFCPVCKTILIPSPPKLNCKSCNFSKPLQENDLILQKESIDKKQIGKGVAEKDFSGHHFKCKKCGNDKCKIIDIGMMFGDEDWVYLLECTKCGHSKRIGDWC